MAEASETSRDHWAALPPEEDRPADVREVGVGPWPGGRAAWPQDPRYDPVLLREGDRRNVVDRYRYWRIEAIREDLAGRALSIFVPSPMIVSPIVPRSTVEPEVKMM